VAIGPLGDRELGRRAEDLLPELALTPERAARAAESIERAWRGVAGARPRRMRPSAGLLVLVRHVLDAAVHSSSMISVTIGSIFAWHSWIDVAPNAAPAARGARLSSFARTRENASPSSFSCSSTRIVTPCSRASFSSSSEACAVSFAVALR
jgi:hypothetical protein